jgi:hypothetical protein
MNAIIRRMWAGMGDSLNPMTIDELNNLLGPPPVFDIRQTGSYLAATPAQRAIMLGQQPVLPRSPGSGIGLQFTKTGLQLPGGTELKYTTLGIGLIVFALIQHKGYKKR